MHRVPALGIGKACFKTPLDICASYKYQSTTKVLAPAYIGKHHVCPPPPPPLMKILDETLDSI